MTIKQWQEYINKWADGKGWNEDLRNDADSIGKQVTNMHSELSEAWEEIKNGHKPEQVYFDPNELAHKVLGIIPTDSSIEKIAAQNCKPEGFGIELADCVIRIMHSCEYYRIDLEKMIEIKMKYNETRSYRHGGKKA